jgi:hypothetical protein
MSSARLGGVAAMLGGVFVATAVIGTRLDDDPDQWDCNSLADRIWEVADSLGFSLLAAAFLAVGVVQRGRGGRAGDAGSLLGALGSVAIAASNPLEHCAGFPALGFLVGIALLTVGTLVLSIAVLRASVLPRWVAAVLVISVISPLALGERGVIVTGIAWLLVGFALVRIGARARTPA